MDASETKSSRNPEKEKCIAHYWKSANSTIQVLKFAVSTGIKSVALGSEHCLFLGHNGKVYARGCNTFGQLGMGDFVDRNDSTEVQCLASKTVVRVECGVRHSGVLTSKGHVYCWGDSASGQCGVGESVSVNTPARLYFIDDKGKDTASVITNLALGELHSLCLTIDGQVWAWGSGCALGIGEILARAITPQLVEDLIGKKVISIACGNYHSLAVINVDDSTDMKTSRGTNATSPSEQNDPKKRTGFSTQIKVSRRIAKETSVERSQSMPMTRKPGTQLVSLNESDCSSSESDTADKDGKSSLKFESLKPDNVKINVKSNVSDVSESPLDAGISKLTDVVMKSVSGVLSYTSSLTGQAVASDSSDVPTPAPKTSTDASKSTSKTVKKNPKVQGCDAVSVQVWAWGRGTLGQLGHGTTQDKLVWFSFSTSFLLHFKKLLRSIMFY